MLNLSAIEEIFNKNKVSLRATATALYYCTKKIQFVKVAEDVKVRRNFKQRR